MNFSLIQIISLFFLLASSAVIFILFSRKINNLVLLPQKRTRTVKEISFCCKKKIKESCFMKSSFWNGILLKILSKTRVFLLKIENKVANYLQKLRVKSQKKEK